MKRWIEPLLVVGAVLWCLGAMFTSGTRAQSPPAPRAPAFAASFTPMMQSATNPIGFDAGASPDHAMTGGTPPVNLVTNYKFEALNPTTLAIVKAVDLGMPPLVGGDIQWRGMAAFRVGIPDGTYVARLWAEGPGGRTASNLSDPFSLAPVLPVAPRGPGKPRWVQSP